MLSILVLLSAALSLVACKPYDRPRVDKLKMHPVFALRFIAPHVCPDLPPVDSSVGCPSGKSVEVQPGDTCQTIAVANSVAAQTFARINDLKPSCSDLIAGSTLCLPEPCETYLVQPGDTCEKIALQFGISVAEFTNLNKDINDQCTNLLADLNVCVMEEDDE